MSEIFLATQSGLAGFNKLVVLKTILPDISGEEDFVRMFLDEARTTAAFNQPNIAQVFELDVADGQLFMAMEFVQGCTLVEMARACRLAKESIPVGFTLQAVRDTALALHYAHNFTDARGRKQVVIHRDVAEKNIMVTYEGVTKLLDFGIAKALGRANRTTVGMVKGTSGYMSPEQIRGEPLDGRSDVFALGVVLHECLTGMRLFHGKKPEDGMMAALKETVAPPSKLNSEVSPELDAIVLKSLERKREDRFTTALEMARAIEKAAQGLIWHPEQTAELVTKHFSERRLETRRLLEGSSFAEPTGEVPIEGLIAKVKASQTSQGEPKPLPPPAIAPVASTSLANAAPAIAPVTVPPSSRPTPPRGGTGSPPPSPAAAVVTSPSAVKRAENLGRAGEKVSTSPARPKVARPGADEPKAINLPGAMPMAGAFRGGHADFDDDDSEAKTIPAAALPDDIKALRKMLQERREVELAKQKEAGAFAAPAPARTAPIQETTEPGVKPSLNSSRASAALSKPTSDKGSAAHAPKKATGERPAPPKFAPSQYPTGEQDSITAMGPDPVNNPQQNTDFESDDGLTAVAAPAWADEGKRPTKPASKRSGSLSPRTPAPETPANEVASVPQRRVVLITIIIVALLIAAAFLMMLVIDAVPQNDEALQGRDDAPLVPAGPQPKK